MGREGPGFWLRVILPDGRVAYVLGDTVEPLAVDTNAPDAPSRPGFFAPPALQEAHGGFALTARGSSVAMVTPRSSPAIVLAPSIAIEPYAGIVLSDRRPWTILVRWRWDAQFRTRFGPLRRTFIWAAGGFTTVPNPGCPSASAAAPWLHARATAEDCSSRSGGGFCSASKPCRWCSSSLTSKQSEQSYVAGLGTYFLKSRA